MKSLTLILILLVALGCAALSGASNVSQRAADREGFSETERASGITDQSPPVINAFFAGAPEQAKVIKIADARVRPARVGVASWYGLDFSGKKTASGEVFDDTKMTAAHKTLPLGTQVRVTNMETGKSVKVIINDRGPYVQGRIIDLSHAAAKALGIAEIGIAPVRLKILQEPDSPCEK